MLVILVGCLDVVEVVMCDYFVGLEVLLCGFLI